MNNKHNTINYIEFGGKNMKVLQDFYGSVFGWTFTEYGPEYLEFRDGVHVGGFNGEAAPSKGGALVIMYSEGLEATRDAIKAAGGTVTQDIYSFPGGRRFHFADPEGNELAVWSDK